MRAFVFALLAVAFATAALADEARIPFTLTSQNNIAVRAVLNSTDALTLMLHTAERDLTLTEEAVKRTRSLKFDGASSTQSWGGRSNARYSSNNTLEIGPLVRTGLAVWEDKNSGPGTDGKFGLDFFKARFAEIDYDNTRIATYDRPPAKISRYTRAKLEDRDGELFVEGRIPIAGQVYAVKFLIHSGYGGAILLDDAFVAASGIGAKVEITGETVLKDSFDNTIKVKKGILPEFAIGNLTLKDVPVGFFEGKLGQQDISVMGAEVLKRFNLIFDKKTNVLYLAQRTPR